MSDLNMKVLKGIIGASAGVIQGIFDFVGIPKTIIKTNAEALDPAGLENFPSTKLNKASMLIAMVKFLFDGIYYYDEEVGTTKGGDRKMKWTIGIGLSLLFITFAATLYYYYGKNVKAKRFLSGYFFPLLSVGLAGLYLVYALAKKKNDNDVGLAIFGVFGSILGLWKLTPIKQALAKDPVDGPVIIAALCTSKIVFSGIRFIFLPYSNPDKGTSHAPLQLA